MERLRINPSSRSNHFFAAFQRYISLTSPSRRHIHHQVPTASRATSQSYPHAIKQSRNYASTSTPPSAPQRKSETPIYYDLFPTTLPHGPPPKGIFFIDPKALRREFLQLQARAHPDRHTGPDKARAEGTSALINEAYKTLQSPLLRAQYLLSLRGIDVAEDERLKVEDPELLMEVLEVRESIEGAEEEGELDGLKRGNKQNIERSVALLKQAFEHDDIDEATKEAVKLRYWINIKESLDGWERGKPVILAH